MFDFDGASIGLVFFKILFLNQTTQSSDIVLVFLCLPIKQQT